MKQSELLLITEQITVLGSYPMQELMTSRETYSYR
jgi:hypothetical protein